MNVFPFDPANAGSLVTVTPIQSLPTPVLGWHKILSVDNTRLWIFIFDLVPNRRVYVLPVDGGLDSVGIGGEQNSGLLIHSFFFPGLTQGDIYVYSDGTADIRYLTGIVRPPQ